jgi:hypothetical protein
MLQQTLRLITLITLLASCGRRPDKAADAGSAATHTKTAGCYAYINSGRDTVELRLYITEHKVTGDMVYKLHEKDANQGTLQGELKADTLFADYLFTSEGKESVREVAFLKQGNSLVEGFGEVEERDGRMAFTNRKALDFNGTIVLDEVACAE